MTSEKDDFQTIEHDAADKRRQQDKDDFNNELAGRDVGRIKRFLPSTHTQTAKNEKRNREMSDLSRLAILMQDPVYRAAFDQAEQTIDDFKTRMNEWLQEYENRIEDIDEKLEALGPDAIGTPDYERLIKEREDIQRSQQDLLDYYYTVVQPMEDRMNDPDNPPSKKELDEFNNQVQQDMDKVFPPVPGKLDENAGSKIELDMNLPSLG